MRIAIYCHSIAPSIDGVCRRFSGILTEYVRQKHEVILFTLEDEPEDLPDGLIDVISLDWMIAPAYPGKKIARTNIRSLMRIYNGLRKHRPDVVHITTRYRRNDVQTSAKLHPDVVHMTTRCRPNHVHMTPHAQMSSK